MSLTTAGAALQILSTSLKTLKDARESLKGSKDLNLKTLMSTLYDEMLELKEAVIRVTDENEQLKAKEAAKPELRQEGDAFFYFDANDRACCQPCYDKTGKLAVLSIPQARNGGLIRKCAACSDYFYSQRPTQPNIGTASSGGSSDVPTWLPGNLLTGAAAVSLASRATAETKMRALILPASLLML